LNKPRYSGLIAVCILLWLHCGIKYPGEASLNPYNIERSIAIMSRGRATAGQLTEFFHAANSKLGQRTIRRIAQIYIEEARIENVNSDIAFCQMCLETGYLRFGGSVKRSQNNFCGLGATGGGTKGVVFSSERSGIRAHIQHLKAYGSRKRLKRQVVDPRFRFVKRASAKFVQDLSRRWAVDPSYGVKIKRKLNTLNEFF